MDTLKCLGDSNGEQLYLLGFNISDDVIELDEAIEVPGSKIRTAEGQDGFAFNHDSEVQIVKELRKKSLHLASIHNHPSVRKDRILIDASKLSPKDKEYFELFRTSQQCEHHFIVAQYPQPYPDNLPPMKLRQDGGVVQFFTGGNKCELILFQWQADDWMQTAISLLKPI